MNGNWQPFACDVGQTCVDPGGNCKIPLVTFMWEIDTGPNDAADDDDININLHTSQGVVQVIPVKTGSPAWQAHSIHGNGAFNSVITLKTSFSALTSVDISVIHHSCGFLCGADTWDIANVKFTAYQQPNIPTCVVNELGNPNHAGAPFATLVASTDQTPATVSMGIGQGCQ